MSNAVLSVFGRRAERGYCRVWGLPNNTHGFLLPLLSQCLPLADEIRRRSVNFIKVCMCNESSLVRAITAYSIQYGRYNMLLGHNALFCSQMYDCSVQDIICGNVNSIVNNFNFVSNSAEVRP
jgi:hypothetical protein